MKKSVFRGLLLILICLLGLSAIMICRYHSKENVKSTALMTFGTAKRISEITNITIEEEKEEEIPLTMSNVSSVVLTNKGAEGDVNSKRAGLLQFFYIPIVQGATLNIANNSDDYKYSVIGFSDDLIYDYTGSGWILPQNATVYKLEQDKKYITVNIARADGQDVDISAVDLSDFIVTYSDSNENLLDTLLPTAEIYNKSVLKEYDYGKLSVLSKTDTVAHACATDINENKATVQALKNAVESEGFRIVEIDVRETGDNLLVCYHDEIITNTRVSIKHSPLAVLKNAKPDIASLDEILDYCGTNNVGVVLDVKDIYSSAGISYMFSLIEKNGLRDKFFFAGCPQYLLNNMPDEYKNVSYSNYLSWDDSFNEQNNIRCSNGCGSRIDLIKLTNILKAGHRSFELYDTAKNVSSTDTFKNDLAVFMYLCSVYDASYNLTLYNNITVPVLSEKEIISAMPKDFWDSLDMILYE